MQASPRIDELRQKFHENPRRYFAPLANEYRKAGDPEQAIAICRAHLAQQPGHMSGHVVYGQALYDAKRPEEARSVFEKALSLDPDNTIVLRHLGDIAREKGESAEARHWYSKALDLDPHDTEVAAYIAELTEPISDDVAPADVPAAASDQIQPTMDSPQPVEVAAHIPEAEEPAVGAPEIPAAVPPVETIAELPELEAPSFEEPPPEILDFVEADTEEAVAVATPAEPQGDGADPVSQDVPPVETLDDQISDREAALPLTQEPEIEPAPDDAVAVEDSPVSAPAEATPAQSQGEDAEDIEAAGEVAWRKTPRPQESPFITRTMADLYARQGYLAAALDVYRQLAIRHPHDEEIRQRIADLSKERGEGTGPSTQEPAVAEAAAGVPSPVEEPPAEPPQIDEPAAVEEPAGTFAELSDEPVYAPSSEDLNLETEDVASGESGLHFTEMELSDSLSTTPVELDDSPFGELAWENEVVEPEPAAPAPAPVDTDFIAAAEAASEAAIPQEARFVELPVALGDVQTSIDEAGVAATSPHDGNFPPAVAEEQAAEAALEPTTVEDEAAAAMIEPEAVAEEIAPVQPGEPEAAPQPEPEESAVVAYSPEPPRGEDLPHFTPRKPTIGEFFATLGAYRPQSRESITARAAIPDLPAATESAEDLPLATDAFSTLFPDAPVNEEDTRAAFALSGAMSGTAHNPTPTTVRTSPPKPVPSVTDAPEQTRESEEDIRRFREWLDGLADS